MFLPPSRVLQPTRHLRGTPLQPFYHFSDPSFDLGPAALLFRHTYLEFLRATNAMEHVLLVGKTHRVMTRLVRLAAVLAARHRSTYPRGSKIVFGVTQPYSQNQPLYQGSTTDFSLAVEPARCALSAYGRTSARIRQILSRLLQVGQLDLPAA